MKVLLTATVQSHICQFHKPLVKMLHEHSAEVHVAANDNLAVKNGLKLDFADKVFNIPFSRSPKSPDNIKAYKMLKEIIDNENYDIIHCNTPMGGIVTRLAARDARKKGTKVFYTAHGFHFYKGASIINWLIYYPIEKYFAKHYTDKLITIVSEDYKTATNKKFNCDIIKTNGVGFKSEKYFKQNKDYCINLRKQFGFEEKDFICICTGELNKNKNQKFLINCVPDIIKQIPNFKLLLAGNGSEKENLEKSIKILNLNNNVKLLGYKTDLENFINLSDISISVSKREGLGLNLLEAMACGKPVIGSNNRGHREFIINNENGFIINSKQELINCVIKLYKDKNLYNKFSENDIKTAKLYSDINVIKELKTIYFNN